MQQLCALIIETRPIPGLTEIIYQHERFLPKVTDVYHLSNEPINSIRDYNRFLTSKRLWRNIPTEKVLIFQFDSELWRTGIEEHLQFDFTGAHIKNIPGCFNGGLSIRDKKAMMKVIDTISYQGEAVHGNEDIFYCNALRQIGGLLPTKEQSQKFSIETEMSYGSIGGHAIEKYLSLSECQAVRNQYL